MSPALVIQKLLIDSGVVTLPGIQQRRFTGKFQCFSPSMADDIDEGVLVRDDRGSNQGRLQRTGKHLEHHGIMIAVRSMTQAGRAVLEATLNVLDSVKRTVVRLDAADYTLQSVYRTSTPGYAGEEEGKRRFYYAAPCRVVMDLNGVPVED